MLGPGLVLADADVQIDLAPHVGASLEVMRRDAAKMRDSGPTLFTSVRNNDGVKDVVDAILGAWRASGAAKR
jgi:urease accessory protein